MTNREATLTQRLASRRSACHLPPGGPQRPKGPRLQAKPSQVKPSQLHAMGRVEGSRDEGLRELLEQADDKNTRSRLLQCGR